MTGLEIFLLAVGGWLAGFLFCVTFYSLPPDPDLLGRRPKQKPRQKKYIGYFAVWPVCLVVLTVYWTTWVIWNLAKAPFTAEWE